MKNLKHTPAPWILQNDSTIRNKGKNAIIVQMGSADNNHPETVANAKLIASAPELLDALTFLLSSYKADFETITGAPLNDTEAVKKAINAIKKATI